MNNLFKKLISTEGENQQETSLQKNLIGEAKSWF